MQTPRLDLIEGVHVVRDDLFAGGTKARFLPSMIEPHAEVVYASPCEGGAQVAIAIAAKAVGRRATIFVAKRAQPHARTWEAKAHGAKIMQVEPGYLSTVKARARDYAQHFRAHLLPFGLASECAEIEIATTARSLGAEPDEVWCAAGSGTLMRGLSLAFPKAQRHAVQVGRALSPQDVAGATIHAWPKAFGTEGPPAPFPADQHYDAKAWAMCLAHKGAGRVLFWNVIAPSQRAPRGEASQAPAALPH